MASGYAAAHLGSAVLLSRRRVPGDCCLTWPSLSFLSVAIIQLQLCGLTLNLDLTTSPEAHSPLFPLPLAHWSFSLPTSYNVCQKCQRPRRQEAGLGGDEFNWYIQGPIGGTIMVLTGEIAGGGAGMMEALVCHPLGRTLTTVRSHSAHTLSRHHQSSYAAIATSQSTRSQPSPVSASGASLTISAGQTARFLDHWERYSKARDTIRIVQRSRRCRHWHRAEDGNSIYLIWVV